MYQLYIKQKVFKLRDKYPILDSEGKEVYHVEQDFKLIGNTVHVNHVNGTRSFVVDRQLFRFFFPRYDVDFSDGTSISIQQNFSFFKKNVNVESDEFELHLTGDIFDLDFQVLDGTEVVGTINRKWLSWGDTYVINVIDGKYEEELIALLIVIDDIIDRQKQSNSNNS